MSMTEAQLTKARTKMMERLESELLDVEFKAALRTLVQESGREALEVRKIVLALANVDDERLVTFLMEGEAIGEYLQLWRQTDGSWNTMVVKKDMRSGVIGVVVDTRSLGRELGSDILRVNILSESGQVCAIVVEGIAVSFILTKMADDGSESDMEFRIKKDVVDYVKGRVGEQS